jgi:uncharacterized protein YydD (DUF2326 family)
VERWRKIGQVKSKHLNRNFDVVYDFWKRVAGERHKYFGELKLTREGGIVNISIKLEDITISEPVDLKTWKETD